MNADQKILEKSIISHTEEAVRIIENFDEKAITDFIQLLPIELSVVLISKMTRYKAARILEKADQETALMLIEKLPISIAKVLLRQIDEQLFRRLLDNLPSPSSKTLTAILKYPENAVGAYIDPVVFTLQENDTVQDGLEKIKKAHTPLLQQIFVLSDEQSLAGSIDLKQLLSSDSKALVRSIMHTEVQKIKANMDVSVLKKEQWWNELFPYLAVVDSEGVFLGVTSKKMLTGIKTEKKTTDLHAIQAGVALGDLFQIGLASFFRGVIEVMDHRNLK